MSAVTRIAAALAATALFGACSQDVPMTAVDEPLLSPEPGAARDEYRHRTTELRVYGIQPGEPPGGPFATVADTSDWSARDLRVGDAVGRSLRVEAVDEEGVTLRSAAGGRLRLGVGEDVTVRRVVHRFDEAAIYLGKHRWQVDPGALADVRARYGTGASAVPLEPGVFADPGVRLVEVDASGLFGRLGFRVDDLLFTVDGAPVLSGELDAVADRLVGVDAKPLAIRMLRNGHAIDRVYFGAP